MTNLKKYALIGALVLPTAFGLLSSDSQAAKAVKNDSLASAVNVRSEAKVADNILGLIDNDKEYDVKEEVDGWLKIDFDGKEAYVGAYWFNIIEETEVISPANFRKGDSTSSEIISVLNKGDKVEVKALAKNGYYKVNFNGKEGYVYSNLLDLSKVAVAQQAVQTSTSNNYQAPSQQYYSYQEETYSAPAETYSYNDYSYTGSSSSAKEIIAQRESGGSYSARNGQYIGRYQLSASYLGGDWSAENQERVADNYVAQRYGSWENALEFWNNNGWY